MDLKSLCDLKKPSTRHSRHSNMKMLIFDMLESNYTILSSRIRNAIHTKVLKGPFAKQLESFTPAMNDEVFRLMHKIMGQTGQKEINVKIFDIICNVTVRAANRVLVGEDLCTLRLTI